MPDSLQVPPAAGGGRARVKACILEDLGVAGVRILLFPGAGADTRWILLFDVASGEPLAVVDEAWSYPHRSVAALAWLVHRLRPADVRSVALLGAGRIGRAALPYVGRLFPEAGVGIASRRPETRGALAEHARTQLGMRASPTDVEPAVRAAQVILDCTGAASVVRDPWVGPGAVVGSLETRGCDPALFADADVRVVDRREQLEEELIEAFGPDAPGHVETTAAEVSAGVHPGRTHAAQRIVVITQGLVSQDVALAARTLERARRAGAGTRLAIPPGP
jgi:ornithine cyclodeaminase/alanine dehydrogenase-like protein (mu-crystallin family)